MSAQFQFVGGAGAPARMRLVIALCAVSALSIVPFVARADQAPSGAVGRLTGQDISVEGGVGSSGQSTVPASIYVANGSVVVVHSGKARMTLFAGGKLEICGPAKFTVLRTADAVTIALSFGHVRAELPAKTSLKIFTPTIIGTPIDISGGARDVSVGLNLDDSLCVLATSGAIQLEHQFTGEKIIVPEAGEFFLNAGKLLPIAGTPGTCQCLDEEDQPAPVAQPGIDYAVAAPAPSEQPAETAPAIEYSVLERGNQGHPVATSERVEAPVAPQVLPSTETTVMPVLEFNAGTPLERPGPSEAMLVLIREARVSPSWRFTGRVEPPQFAAAMQNALGEKPAADASNAAPPPAQGQKKKGGFWAALKRAFGGA